ncbi:MAG: hypothetical protein PHU25_18585 [Deltaproteobacteria bacterium]|nr:hypothetical protein [Deltaproteobacteria bacterium]
MEQAVFRNRLASCLKQGTKSGMRTFAWLAMLVVPVSLLVTLLAWSGLLSRAAVYVAPAFHLVGLPEEAAAAFLTGVLVNCYSGIAAMGSIPMTDKQVTILALMILFAHNLVVEAPVQRKAGSSAVSMIVLRLGSVAAGAAALSLLMPDDSGPARARGVAEASSTAFLAVLESWAQGTGVLLAKIAALVLGLTIVQRVLDDFGLIRVLARWLGPVLFLLGLSRRVAFLWMVANTLGLAYGAGVILDEVERKGISRDEVDLLNRSIAVCHSLLEDTLLFVAVGASAFWITVPRVVAAALAVWGTRAWRRMRHHP